MKRAWTISSLFIIVLLGITSVVCAKGILQSLVSRQIDSWVTSQPTIYTSQLTDNQKDNLCCSLRDFSSEDNFITISCSTEHLQSGATLYTFSVLVPPTGQMVSIRPLSVLNTPVMDDSIIGVC